MDKKIIIALVIIALVVVGVIVYYYATMQQKKSVTIVILSPEWDPGKKIEEMASSFTAYAEKVLGYPVYVRFDFTPWGTYYQRVTTIVTAKSSEVDLIFSDSQWLGELYEGGHIIDLTDWINSDPDMKAAVADTYDNLVKYYMTYPQGSTRYVGVPGYADSVMLLYYRTDLFNDPTERANFKAKYGYDLPQTLEDFKKLDWTQLRDIAEFFTRKKGETLAGQTLTDDFYGITLVLSRDYDYISCTFLSMYWSWGAELWNPSTMDPRGYINGAQAVEALSFLLNLTKYTPPSPATYDYDKVITTFSQGKAAMTILWPSMAPALFDPATSRVADKVGVAILPHHNGVRYVTLGGQPLVISSYSTHKEEAKLFIKWFYTVAYKDYSLKVGFTARKSIAQSQEFLNSKPWARAFVESLPYAKDFWNVPFYGRLLEIQQKYWNMVVAGEITPKEAADNIATEQWAVVQQFKK